MRTNEIQIFIDPTMSLADQLRSIGAELVPAIADEVPWQARSQLTPDTALIRVVELYEKKHPHAPKLGRGEAISRSTLSRIMTGVLLPTPEWQIRVARAAGWKLGRRVFLVVCGETPVPER